MITKSEILQYVESINGACYDCPFEGDFFSTVLRLKKNRKWFGIIIHAPDNYFSRYGAPVPQDKTVLCLKCPPDLRDFLSAQYPAKILSAYHMNKKHWISAVLGSDIPLADVKKLIDVSFEITQKSK